MQKRNIHKCVCGWNGRADQTKHHQNVCTGRKIIETLQNELFVLRRICNDIPSKVFIENIDNLKKDIVSAKEPEESIREDTKGFMYLIQTRESIRLEENVYKIGKTYNIEQRLSQYPKGSILHKKFRVSDRHLSERIILREFNEKFMRKDDMGNEYFEGDLQHMLKIFEEFDKIFSRG